MAHRIQPGSHSHHGINREDLRRWRHWIVAVAALLALILATSTANT